MSKGIEPFLYSTHSRRKSFNVALLISRGIMCGDLSVHCRVMELLYHLLVDLLNLYRQPSLATLKSFDGLPSCWISVHR